MQRVSPSVVARSSSVLTLQGWVRPVLRELPSAEVTVVHCTVAQCCRVLLQISSPQAMAQGAETGFKTAWQKWGREVEEWNWELVKCDHNANGLILRQIGSCQPSPVSRNCTELWNTIFNRFCVAGDVVQTVLKLNKWLSHDLPSESLPYYHA